MAHRLHDRHVSKWAGHVSLHVCTTHCQRIQMIPPKIHQTWKDRDVPERFRAAQESWRQHHPGWQYRFWTDADLDELVYERAPEIAELYDRSPEAIQGVDVARYVILREYGGLYADLDVECMKPVNDLLDGPSVVLPLTTPLWSVEPIDAFRPWARAVPTRH